MGRNLGFLVSLILSFCYVLGQELPPVACPDNFAYLKLDDRYVGQVSVVLNGSSTKNNVTVELSVRGVSDLKTAGSIKLSDSGPTVTEKLQKNEKINFQMDISATDVLPKVRKIVVNGETICQAAPYDPPSTLLIRTLVFFRKNPVSAQDKAEDILKSN